MPIADIVVIRRVDLTNLTGGVALSSVTTTGVADPDIDRILAYYVRHQAGTILEVGDGDDIRSLLEDTGGRYSAMGIETLGIASRP